MAFGNKRKGFSVSNHFQLKPSETIRRKLDRLLKDDMTGFTNVKVANVLIGLLRSRGEKV